VPPSAFAHALPMRTSGHELHVMQEHDVAGPPPAGALQSGSQQ